MKIEISALQRSFLIWFGRTSCPGNPSAEEALGFLVLSKFSELTAEERNQVMAEYRAGEQKA